MKENKLSFSHEKHKVYSHNPGEAKPATQEYPQYDSICTKER